MVEERTATKAFPNLNYFSMPSFNLGFVYTKMDFVFSHSKAPTKKKRNIINKAMANGSPFFQVHPNPRINNGTLALFLPSEIQRDCPIP
jgi:hypothetical protein